MDMYTLAKATLGGFEIKFCQQNGLGSQVKRAVSYNVADTRLGCNIRHVGICLRCPGFPKVIRVDDLKQDVMA